jgi:hypothetical protein
MFEASLQAGSIVVFTLIATFIMLIGFVKYSAYLLSKDIEAEVLKANKRLSDQINSRVG